MVANALRMKSAARWRGAKQVDHLRSKAKSGELTGVRPAWA